MKIVVFAHVPPPHHGQAVMVQQMLNGLQGAENIEFFHVDARVSNDIADVGGMRPGKLLRLLRFCFQAVWYRLRHGADTLYFVPAPAKRSAIVRDWFVMLLVRPCFRKTIFHWHALGLGHWANDTKEFPGGPDAPPLAPARLSSNAAPIWSYPSFFNELVRHTFDHTSTLFGPGCVARAE